MNQEKAWNKIAPMWNNYRKKPMDGVKDFLKNKKGNILDLGCGSGRNFIKTKGTIYGIDFSEQMLKFAKQNAKAKSIKTKLIHSKVSNIPIESNFFDSAIFMATLHCIKWKRDRKKALKELFRTLKPGADAMISIWSRNSKRVKNKPKKTYIPWTKDGEKIIRYYYLYEKPEIEQLIKKVGFKILNSMEKKDMVFHIQKPIS